MCKKIISDRLAPLLDATERALLEMEDDEVEALHTCARGGDEAAGGRLRQWVAITARNYFYLKLQRGDVASPDEARTLAADFLLEFDRMQPQIRQAVHWTRALLPRFVVYARHRQRQAARRVRSVDPFVLAERSTAAAPPAFGSGAEPAWDDTDWHHLRLALRTLEALPEITRTIVRRIFWDAEPPSYRELAEEYQTTEAAIKMRVSRFYQSVRQQVAL